MKVRLMKSKNKKKKFRVQFDNGRFVEFGASEYSDFLKHKDPLRMRRYVRRHGGVISKKILEMTDPDKVTKAMESVTKSSKREDWSKKGIYTPGFWSRWYLWSAPTKKQVKQLLNRTFNITLYT